MYFETGDVIRSLVKSIFKHLPTQWLEITFYNNYYFRALYNDVTLQKFATVENRNCHKREALLRNFKLETLIIFNLQHFFRSR